MRHVMVDGGYCNYSTLSIQGKTVSEVGGSETNREIDFGFGSCVRARALVVRWEFGQIVTCPLSLFPFLPFSPSGFAGKPIMLCVINTKQNTLKCRVLGWVRAFALRKFPRPWQCPNRCFYTPGSILGRILCFSEPYGANYFPDAIS